MELGGKGIIIEKYNIKKLIQYGSSMYAKIQDEGWWEIGYSHDAKVSQGKKFPYKGEIWESLILH